MKERTRLQHELQILTNIEEELENISSDQMTYVEGETSNKTSDIQARILWPALGFPSVIAPNSNDPNKSRPEGDATVCICILLLSNREHLSAEDAARHIRFVPWEKRRPKAEGSKQAKPARTLLTSSVLLAFIFRTYRPVPRRFIKRAFWAAR